MRGKVVVDTLEDFNAWQSEQITFAETQDIPPANLVAGESLTRSVQAVTGKMERVTSPLIRQS